MGLALLGGAAAIAITVTLGIFLPAIGQIGAAAARDPASLPGRISVCGRDWTKDALSRTFTSLEVFERTEAAPIVVSTALLAPCPAGVFPTGDPADGMATVVYAQVGDDALVPYELVGGP